MNDRDITALLGPPDKTWPVNEYTPPLPHDMWEYDLGRALHDFAGQHNVLRLYFDKAGRYKQSEITRD